mmetsp:Transcript_41046/g.88956  ORF Transcript_41046/g.88956 Transcript_41046/m.88956 type:complete len:262 (+) Transcript_41046:884-1669(+)
MVSPPLPIRARICTASIFNTLKRSAATPGGARGSFGAKSANHSGNPPGPVWSHLDFFRGFSDFSGSMAPLIAAPALAPPAEPAASPSGGIIGAGSEGSGGMPSGAEEKPPDSSRCGMDSGEMARFFSARPMRPGERLRGFSLTLRLTAFRLGGGICRLLLRLRRAGLRARLSRREALGLLRLRLRLRDRRGLRRRSRAFSLSLLSRLLDFSLLSFLRLSRSLLLSSAPRLSRGAFFLLLLRLLLPRSFSRALSFSLGTFFS